MRKRWAGRPAVWQRVMICGRMEKKTPLSLILVEGGRAFVLPKDGRKKSFRERPLRNRWKARFQGNRNRDGRAIRGLTIEAPTGRGADFAFHGKAYWGGKRHPRLWSNTSVPPANRGLPDVFPGTTFKGNSSMIQGEKANGKAR